MCPKAGSRSRGLLRTLSPLFTALIAVGLSLRSPSPALGQSVGHMGEEGTGFIEIKSDLERQAFSSLACSCGCPHEALSSCRCGPSDRYRAEIRAMIAEGLSLEQIKAEWVKRYGSEKLAVPPNSGGNQFLYVVPLVLIVAAAGIVILAIRRFRRHSDDDDRRGPAPVAAGGKADEYDAKLDDELKQLDRDQ